MYTVINISSEFKGQGHISLKCNYFWVHHFTTRLRQFLIISFHLFHWTDRLTDTRTDDDKPVPASDSIVVTQHGVHTGNGTYRTTFIWC